jgi:hypothetical protein
MIPPPPDAPTPSTLGAVDLDPWIPKLSARDIVDHLVHEINAAKELAQEITCVQSVLDGMMEGTQVETGIVEQVQKELEEKTKRVAELEELLGMEREEKRVLEEKIRTMEDERALNSITPVEESKDIEIDRQETDESSIETAVDRDDTRLSPIRSLAIPEIELENTTITESEEEIGQSPSSPSTAPSSPSQTSSGRSISPISLPSTDSSNNDNTKHLIDKISLLESQLASAHKVIEEYKTKLEQASPVLSAVTAAITSSSIDFPFTFTATPTTPKTPTRIGRSKLNGSVRSRGSVPRNKPAEPTTSSELIESAVGKGKDNRELIEGLCAAVGVVVLGWMGMWLVNHLVERGQRVVK